MTWHLFHFRNVKIEKNEILNKKYMFLQVFDNQFFIKLNLKTLS